MFSANHHPVMLTDRLLNRLDPKGKGLGLPAITVGDVREERARFLHQARAEALYSLRMITQPGIRRWISLPFFLGIAVSTVSRLVVYARVECDGTIRTCALANGAIKRARHRQSNSKRLLSSHVLGT